ncbi:hypothetical protein [Dongia rigui]|uniref:Sulfotransferase n=1 Tax=Dongia rigui TaxID=940149 RepID=A0ABU5E4B5_9PROT|nr:hypothetical protein [Dongia rigui]MDY0873661.1 hypothetical protein [Dongia rigui]
MCEVELNGKEISRWGRKLLRAHADLTPFFKSDNVDPLENYRRAHAHLSARGHARRMFGDKFVGIENGFSRRVGSANVIFSVRHLPEWLAKDSIRAEYKCDHNIVPLAVQYTRHFIESFQVEKVLHVRFSDFLNRNQQIVDAVWRFLEIEPPKDAYVWWDSIGAYQPEDPKASMNWWRGHASSAVKPESGDTQVKIAPIAFWQRILPIFDRYYEAAGQGVKVAQSEIEADLLALDAIAKEYTLPIDAAYLHNYSKSANPDIKTKRRNGTAPGWKSLTARIAKWVSSVKTLPLG